MKITPDFTRLHSGENIARTLQFSLSEAYLDKSVKLCFITPLGKLFITDELSHSNGTGSYQLPSAVLDGKGVLLCQLICYDSAGFIAKSPVLELPVFYSADDMSCPALSDESIKSLTAVLQLLDEKSDRIETIALLRTKSDINHLHSGVYLTKEELWDYLPTHPSAGYEHTHDSRYYTKTQTDSAIADHAADFVVEQGVSDSWNYRKWNSGVVECWGLVDMLISKTGSIGAVSGVSTLAGYLALPSFVRVQTSYEATITANPVDWWYIGCQANHYGNKAAATVYGLTASMTAVAAGSTVKMNFHVSGRWK